jgi:hypothetical protein
MSEIAIRFISGLASPLIALSEKIHKYQEKRETREQFASALQSEIKDYEVLINELMELGKKSVSIVEQIEEQPTPRQVFEVLDCLSQSPRLVARFLMLFIKLARACKEISSQRAFMDSLKESSHFLHDFVERMGEAYIEKDTVIIDGRFFRFFSTYRKEILKRSVFKGVEMSKMNKKDIKSIEDKVNAVIRCFNQPFLQRYVRNPTMKKWKKSLLYLDKTAQSITFEPSSTTNLDEFIPFDLQTLAKLLKGYS